MITKEELEVLISSVETFRIEKTISATNMDKFCEAICAFANDMPNSKLNGYLLIGITDDGKRSGLKVTDELLKKISSIRSDGNILPMPVMSVEVFSFDPAVTFYNGRKKYRLFRNFITTQELSVKTPTKRKSPVKQFVLRGRYSLILLIR